MFRAHGHYVFDYVALSADGETLVASTMKGRLYVWDMETGKHRSFACYHQLNYRAIALSPDGKTLASPNADMTVRLWDLAAGEQRAVLKGHTAQIWFLTFSPDGNILASASTDGTVKLWNVANGQLQHTLQIGSNSIPSVAFSPDGATLAVGLSTYDKERRTTFSSVQLWNVAEGTKAEAFGETEGSIPVLAYSPDGKTLALACSRSEKPKVPPKGTRSWNLAGTVTLWDTTTYELRHTLSIGRNHTMALAFSPEGKTLASAHWYHDYKAHRSYAGVTTWNVADGKPLGSVPLESDIRPYVLAMAFSADRKSVSVATAGESVSLWDVATGRIRESFGIPTGPVYWVAFSPDGEALATTTRNAAEALPGTLASAGAYGEAAITKYTVRLRDWRSGRQRAYASYLSPMKSKPSMAFSPDGRYLGGQVFLSLPNLTTHKPSDDADQKSRRHRGAIYSAAFSPNSKIVATAGSDGTVNLWGAEQPALLATLKENAKFCLSVAFSPDGKTLAAAADKTVQLWDVESRKLREVLRGHTDFVRCVAYSHDGKTPASGSSDGTVRLWDMPPGRLRATLQGHKGGVSFVVISPDDRTVASAGRDGTVKLWDLESGEEKATLRGHAGWVTSVAFSPDGRTLASGSVDGSVRLWRGASDEELQRRTANAR